MNYQKTEVRAIDHIGITVPDIAEAAEFLEKAFGATAIYDNIVPADEPTQGPDAEAKLGIAKGTAVVHMRMMRIGDGACIELFEMKVPGQRQQNIIPSDIGLQHFAVYTDDIEKTKEKFLKAGGRLLKGPNDMLGREGGEGNQFMYAVTPWGTFVELITYPSELEIEKTTVLRRWKPQPGKEE
ncbi:VOC family protein [Olivibacter sitiensis]|uniref:VOC family protein n=1 Tax=Olivibacter sitiensis TaxID=376470 RepID=UPI00040AD34E|nr:VOC family protein [Olivibacter sitiensis]